MSCMGLHRHNITYIIEREFFFFWELAELKVCFIYLQKKHGVSFHCYADDTQLYISSRPGETHQIEKLMECIVDIKNWMTSNFLLLNSEKTEVLITGPKTPTSNNLEHCLTLDGCSVNSSSSVRNLGVLFNSNLSFDSHVSSICKTAFFSS